MTQKFSAEQKLDVLAGVIGRLCGTGDRTAVPTVDQIAVLRSIEVEIRSQSDRQIGKVLEAMTFQVEMARRSKARLGFIEHGNMQTLAEGICGAWWTTIKHCLQHEKEAAKT
jgi:hypothetical protein